MVSRLAIHKKIQCQQDIGWMTYAPESIRQATSCNSPSQTTTDPMKIYLVAGIFSTSETILQRHSTLSLRPWAAVMKTQEHQQSLWPVAPWFQPIFLLLFYFRERGSQHEQGRIVLTSELGAHCAVRVLLPLQCFLSQRVWDDLWHTLFAFRGCFQAKPCTTGLLLVFVRMLL